jgi:hypothetical protein
MHIDKEKGIGKHQILHNLFSDPRTRGDLALAERFIEPFGYYAL